ncbi:hypothetical protein Dcar01_01305 [Deinococcus carri]|uniref:Uncharacterized protein n=1 Tax=Deinococcus carri TaxID=1211323 RepID=A0ABP9W5D6_9DEIO
MNADLPPAVAAYLRTATRLLLPGSGQPAHAELHANLHQAMLDHLTCGRTEPEAWATALRDFGPPWLTALGLARTHTLPLLLRLGLAAGVLGGAASALWTHNLATPPTHPPAHEARP